MEYRNNRRNVINFIYYTGFGVFDDIEWISQFSGICQYNLQFTASVYLFQFLLTRDISPCTTVERYDLFFF